MEKRKILELKNWDKNPRGIKKDDFERLKNQIKRLGVYKPLLINKDNVVLGGNMRLRAYRDLGIDEVEVNTVDAQTEAKMLEYALSDNDRAGYYEEQDLAELITQYAIDIPIDDYRIDLGKLSTIQDLLNQFGPEIIEDEPPPVPEEAESKLGEIYQLGRHRLMCGDATKIEDVEKLMGGKKADVVFTDPPYGVDYEGKTADKLKIENDTNSDIWQQTVGNFSAVVKSGASFYVCCPPGNKFKEFVIPFEDVCNLASTIIWVKNTLIMGHSDYQYKHEPIIYGWLKGGTHSFYGDRTQTTVWEFNKPNSSKLHPTMKPLTLIAKAINNSSKSDDIVLDLFGGSGSTLIAAEQTNRTCYMMELDPKYCDVIRTRFDNFVSKK
jgi:DNA modification methylase